MYSVQNGGAARADLHADLMSAFSNAIRLQILNAIRSREVNVNELCEICHLSQSAVSQHLSRLRRMGIVKTRRESQMVYYSLMSSEAEKLLATLDGIYHA